MLEVNRVSSHTKVKVGAVFESNTSGKFEVIEDLGKPTKGRARLFKIRFLATGYEKETNSGVILQGNIKDRYLPTKSGVGYLGDAKSSDNLRLYNIWAHMLDRCYNECSNAYSRYGGKGVKVHKRWHSFENFMHDVVNLNGYDESLLGTGELHLDKDKKQQMIRCEDKIYSDTTCEWISATENSRYAVRSRLENNQVVFRATDPLGNEYTSTSQVKFAKEHNLSENAINKCLRGRMKLHKGWSFVYV